MQKPTISVIVVSYNTKQMTLECIQSAIEQTQSTSYEIIVYDNDSQDGSAEAIAERFPDVRLIAAKDNIGFAQGNNKAIEQAKGEYILLLNPDTVVLDRAIDKLYDFALQNPQAGIWGGKTLYGDHSLNPGSCFKRMTIWNQFCRASGLAAIFKNTELFNSEHYGGWQRDTVRKVDIVCGCFLLIPAKLWNELEGFSPKFFMYAEEADLCLRAMDKGYSPMITPEAVIVHYGGGSEKVRADKMVRLLAAKVELLNEHWSNWAKPLGRALVKAWVLSRITALWLAAKLRPSAKDSLQAWQNIWSRSKEWANGYTGRQA